MWYLKNKALIYDLEIEKAIPPRDPSKMLEGIEYCAGWHDHENMGISVVCTYDFVNDQYRVFDIHTRDELLELMTDRVLVGFNNINFDNKVLRACWGIDIDDNRCFDILRAIWKANGLGPEYNHETHSGYGLADCAHVNFGIGKTGHGALAPVDWQRGLYAKVIDYCLNDVRLTKKLWERICDQGCIVDPKEKFTIPILLDDFVAGLR